MKKEVKTSAVWELDFISLDKFLDKIEIRETEEEHTVMFNSLLHYSSYGEGIEVEGDTATYKRCLTGLVSDNEGLKSSLITQAKIYTKFYEGFQDLMEVITVDSLMEYGSPEYLVNIGPRMWMAANPSDFIIYRNSKINKKALACIAQGRLIINNVLKISEAEAKKAAEKLMEKKDEI